MLSSEVSISTAPDAAMSGDTSRFISLAPGAVEIDTSELSIQEVLDTVLNIALMRNLM